MYVPLVATVTVPWLGAVEAVTVRLEPASLASTDVPFNAVLAAVLPLSLVGRGVTVRLTVAVDVCPLASVAVYVKESGPEYPAVGV